MVKNSRKESSELDINGVRSEISRYEQTVEYHFRTDPKVKKENHELQDPRAAVKIETPLIQLLLPRRYLTEIVAKALDGQRYPMPLSWSMWG